MWVLVLVTLPSAAFMQHDNAMMFQEEE